MPDTQTKQMDIQRWENLFRPGCWSITDPIPETVVNLHGEFAKNGRHQMKLFSFSPNFSIKNIRLQRVGE